MLAAGILNLRLVSLFVTDIIVWLAVVCLWVLRLRPWSWMDLFLARCVFLVFVSFCLRPFSYFVLMFVVGVWLWPVSWMSLVSRRLWWPFPYSLGFRIVDIATFGYFYLLAFSHFVWLLRRWGVVVAFFFFSDLGLRLFWARWLFSYSLGFWGVGVAMFGAGCSSLTQWVLLRVVGFAFCLLGLKPNEIILPAF